LARRMVSTTARMAASSWDADAVGTGAFNVAVDMVKSSLGFELSSGLQLWVQIR
jgi:hypothetical protein